MKRDEEPPLSGIEPDVEPGSVRTKASRGVAFLGMASVAKHLISFARLVVLARLLEPAEFGFFALAMVLYGGLTSVTTFGIDRYLVQKDQLERGLVRSAWGFGILRGIGLGSFVWLSAPLYAAALGLGNLQSLLMLVGLTAVINSLGNPGQVLATRNLRFPRIATYEIVGAVIEALLLVVLAYWLRSAQALAWGLLLGTAVKVVLSFGFFQTVGWPRIRVSDFKELLTVGSRLLVVSIGTFITTQGDDLVAGAVLGATATGIYAVTYRLASMPTQLLKNITTRVSVPAMSRLHSDPERRDRGFAKLVRIQLCALTPIVVLLAGFAPEVIGLVYGDSWQAGASVLRALGLVMIGRGLSHVVGPYLFATGHFTTLSRTKVIELIVFAPAVYFGARLAGLEGLALGAGLAYTVGATILASQARVPGLNWLRELAVAALSAVPALLAGRMARAALSDAGMLQPIGIIAVFGTVYVATVFLFRRRIVEALFALTREAFPRFRHEPKS